MVLKLAGVELKKTNSVGAPVPHVGNKAPFWAAPFQQPNLLYQPPSAQQHLHRPGAVCGLTMLTGTWKILEIRGIEGHMDTTVVSIGILHLWVQAVLPLFSDSNLSDLKEKKRDIFSWTIERWQYLLAVPCGMGVPGSSTKTANRAKIGYVPPTSPNIT